MKTFSSDTQKIGKIGEDVACKFLMKHGFVITERNYTKKCGEIDIVAEKNGKLHFVEVKSVSCEPFSHETSKNNDIYRPEDNMHPWKLKRLSRTIQIYLLSKNVPDEREWQFDVITVFMDMTNRQARVNFIKDIIL